MMTDISPRFNGTSSTEQTVIKRLLRLEATPEAIREFSRCRNQLGDYWYWFLLSTLWVSYTGHSSLDLWKRLLSSDRPYKAESLMKPSELKVFKQLPDTLLIYRAIVRKKATGLPTRSTRKSRRGSLSSAGWKRL